MTDKDPDTGRFLPGNSGFSGRPKGARNKLGASFIEALSEDFQKYGRAVIEIVRDEKPDQYLKIVASLAPKELALGMNDTQALSDEEIVERLRALNETIKPLLDPDGVRRPYAGMDKARAH